MEEMIERLDSKFLAMKVFLDANILFSAAKRDGAMSRFVKYLAQNHTVITSDYAQLEAYRNVIAKREEWFYFRI